MPRDVSERRMTRAEQRVATRDAILDAAVACLAEDAYPALTTRRIAERANVAQSTLMHHFPTREQLLVEAVSRLALRLADDATEDLDLRSPEAVLDRVWEVFTSPRALAAAQLWYAAWAEPELAAALRDLEERLAGLAVATAGALMPELTDDPDFPAFVDTGLALIRGLVMAIPVWGRETVEAQWKAIRPVLLRSARDLLTA
jgi:AcrR family transcriptional regulator